MALARELRRTRIAKYGFGPMKYLFCSVALHVGLLLAWDWSASLHDYRLALGEGDERRVPSSIPVRLLATGDVKPEIPPTAISKPPAETAVTARDEAAVTPPPAPSPALNIPKIADRDFVAAGKLSRLPRPRTEIDLNTPQLQHARFAGRVELMLSIEIDGTVSEVMPLEESDVTRTFTELVAPRFRAAKFFPGEVDGKPVRSRLLITVVSEFVPPPEAGRLDPTPTGRNVDEEHRP